MLSKLLLSIVLMTGVFTLPMLLIHAQPTDNSDLNLFLKTPPGCAAPCFMGIKPGVTTVGETLEILRSNPWIGEISVDAFGEHVSSAFGYAEITWTWSGQQPALIDTSQTGRVSFLWDRERQRNLDNISAAPIETIIIYTTIRMELARLWYGSPDSGQVSERPNQQIAYTAGYHFSQPPGMIQLSTLLPCPANWLTYWNARARIEMTVSIASTAATIIPAEVIDTC